MSVTPSPPLPPCPLSSHLPLVHVIGHIQVIVATNRSPTPAPPVPIEEARKYKGGREGGKGTHLPPLKPRPPLPRLIS